MKKYFLFLPLVLSLTACSSDEISVPEPDFPVDDPDWELNFYFRYTTPEELAVASDLDIFNYNFMNQVAALDGKDHDFCCSPLSAEMYLSALANGAAGNSRTQIMTALNVQDLENLNSLNERLMHFLPNEKHGSAARINNCFWVADRYDVNPEFRSTIKTVFNGVVEPVDFHNPATVPTINKWVSHKTNGLIDKILPGSWKNYVNYPMVSTNTIYFKGDWTGPFEPENTKTEIFHSPKGDRKVSMMNTTNLTYYASHEKFQYVRKTFGLGTNYMELFLPAEGVSINELIKILTPDLLNNLHYSRYHVTMGLPAFKFENEIPFYDITAKMGINMNKLDLSAMGLGTESIKTNQLTSLKINEEGAEFGVAMGVPNSANPDDHTVYPSVTVKFDRPFFYIIKPDRSEVRTGVIMLAGAVVNPKN